jgi:hypothetical protein
MLTANEIKKCNIQPKQSVIDLFAENNDMIFIFEIKSVHVHNFRQQTRRAIGQLLDYEYFQIKAESQNDNKTILKGVVYSNEPPMETVKFLRSSGFNVFWKSADELAGDLDSKKILDAFLTPSS